MNEYIVVPFRTGCMSHSLNEHKLQHTLNTYSQEGWKLSRTIHETQRTFLGFAREAHFLIFERNVQQQRWLPSETQHTLESATSPPALPNSQRSRTT